MSPELIIAFTGFLGVVFTGVLSIATFIRAGRVQSVVKDKETGLKPIGEKVTAVESVVNDPVTGVVATHKLANSNLEVVRLERESLIEEVRRLYDQARVDSMDRATLAATVAKAAVDAALATPTVPPTGVELIPVKIAVPVVFTEIPKDPAS